MNGLRFGIQYELSLLSLRYFEEAYQVALKVEEKLKREQSQRTMVRGFGGREQQHKGETISSNQQTQPDRTNDNRGRRVSSRGRGRGRGVQARCYTSGKLGHMSWDCLEKNVRWRGAHVVQDKPKSLKAMEVAENFREGESLIFRKVDDEASESVERRSLSKTTFKAKAKCCKLIIDSGSTHNLMSTKMVEKLNLRRIIHIELYKVALLQKFHQVLVDEQCQVEF